MVRNWEVLYDQGGRVLEGGQLRIVCLLAGDVGHADGSRAGQRGHRVDPGDCVSDRVERARDMRDPAGVLQDEVHVALFSQRVIGGVAGFEGEDKGLVVCEDLEVTSFEEWHEVAHG